MVLSSSGDAGARRRAPAIVVLAAALAIAAAAPARAGDADVMAVAAADTASARFVAGSATFPDDPRSAIAGRWNVDRAAFDWLWRVDAGPLISDAFSDVVATDGSVFGVGTSNGQLLVAKFDPATGTLRRSCDFDGIAMLGFDAPVLAGKAVALGADVVVVGGTLTRPTRGVVAIVDGDTCALRTSALVGAPASGLDVGFTAVDRDAAGGLLVSGFTGSDAVVMRFGASLEQLAVRSVDLGGTPGDAFTDVRADGDRLIAIGGGATQSVSCFRLPGLEPDAGCGPDSRRPLAFDPDGAAALGAVAAALPSGGWLIAGMHIGRGGFPTVQARAGLAAYTADGLEPDPSVLAPDGNAVFDPFGYQPSTFTGVEASATGIDAVGVSGIPPARVPFFFSAGPDGTRPAFTSLNGFAAAERAPLEPAPPEQPPPHADGLAGPGAAVPVATVAARAKPVGSARLADGRFRLRSSPPTANGGIGTLTLRCASACTARGTYRTGGARVGAITERLRAGKTRRLQLRLSRAGQRRLARSRSGRLRVTVRFAVSDARATTETLLAHVTVRARRVSRSA